MVDHASLPEEPSDPVVLAQAVVLGRQVIDTEVRALQQVHHRLGSDPGFAQAVAAMAACRGNVVIAGVGKSYFIAQKISASMASTGTPSISLHPVDSLHGDLGRIRAGDVVMVLSNSGETSESVEFMRACSGISVCRVVITCRGDSALGRLSDIVVDLGPIQEACFMGYAPSATTTAMLAVGDALALTVAQLKGFSVESFARFHPGGSLGRRFQKVDAVMRSFEQTAVVRADTLLIDVLQEITRKRCGAAYVRGEDGELIGIFTDGDLRRLLTRGTDILSDPVRLHMGTTPKKVQSNELVDAAMRLLKQFSIDELPVVDPSGALVGHLDIQDLTV